MRLIRSGSTTTPACPEPRKGCAGFGGTGIPACASMSAMCTGEITQAKMPSRRLTLNGFFRPTLKFAVPSLLLVLLSTPSARAEYIVLQSGLRLHVSGYQLLGDKYHLQLQGGWMDVSVADVAKIEPEEVFQPIERPPAAAPSPAAAANQSPYHEFVLAAASRYGVDAELISSVMEVESHFNPKAISVKNARGLMQLLPETASRLGVKDIFDPKENIDAGTHYLHDLLQLYNNDLTLALAAYNAGPDKVQRYGNVPPFRETESYVKQVKKKYQKNKSAPAAPTKATTAPASTTAPPPPPSAPSGAPTPPAGSGTPLR